ncbi:MAG: membrane protein insertion efficiency factor YidD [Syntrophaceae bacterium]|nr:membrane protein insertion efficiency factor YidD [Syntrophaceae bacterium]
MFDQSLSGSRGRVKKTFRYLKKGTIYKTVHEWTKKGAILLILFYRYSFSIFFGPCCRFTPSCSSYALLSIHRFGIKVGVRLIFKRIIKCHPFHPGGYDPVPQIPKEY